MPEFSIEHTAQKIRNIEFFSDYDFEWVELTGSTNDDLKKEIAQGACRKILVATQQSHGRGQFERNWHSDPGQALLFSFSGLQLSGNLPLSLLVGAAVAKAILRVLNADIWLKWPNDIYLGQGKLGGILVENIFSGEKKSFVAGIGINLRQPSEIFDAASLEKFDLAPQLLLLEILGAFDQVLKLGLNEQTECWKAYAGKFWNSSFLCSEYSENKEPSLIKPVDLFSDGSLEVLSNGHVERIRSARLELFKGLTESECSVRS